MAQTSTTSTVSDVPDWMRPYLQRLFSSSENLARRPYPTYSGQRIAGFSPTQEQGFGQLGQAATAGIGTLGEAAAGVPGADISAYMNPYIEQAIDPAARQLTRAYETGLQRTGGQAAANNAFGGSRQAVLEGVMNRNYQEGIGNLYATGLSNAYTQGISALQADLERKLRAGPLEQQMLQQGAQGLLAAGGQQQALEQSRRDLAYKDFLEQRDWPYNQQSWLSNIIQGYGSPVGTSMTTQQSPEPNKWAQYLGAGLGGISLLSGSGALDKVGGWLGF